MVKYNIFLILFYLITVKSYQIDVKYNYQTQKENFFSLEGQKYILIENVKLTKKYLKIFTNPKYDFANTATILFYNKETDKREDALLLGDDRMGDNYLYISKDLFDSSVYLNISCFKENSCSYHFKFEETEYIELNRDGFYSYQTNKGNTKNTFMIKRKNENSGSGQLDDEKAIMTFFVNGIDNNLLNVNVEYYDAKKKDKIVIKDIKPFTKGKIITFKEEEYDYDENSYYLMTVDSKTDEYVIVGSRSIHPNEYEYTNHINPNDKAIDGYIKQSVLKRECFNIDPLGESSEAKSFVINIIAYTHNVHFYYIDARNGEDIQEDQKKITDEYATTLTYKDEKNRYFCLKSTNDEDVYYNLQVIDFNRNFFRFDIFSPMMTGYIYTRYLPSKKYTYFTYQNVDNYNVINFNMKVLDGYPKLYFDYCETFPNCEYDQEKIEQLVNDGSIGNPHKINDMYTFSLLKGTENFRYIDNRKYLMIVGCEGDRECKFETSIFTDRDIQNLKSNDQYYQYGREGDNDEYKFYIADKDVKTVIITLSTFSGDTEFKLRNSPSSADKKTFYASNKEFYQFTAKEKNDLVGMYSFSVRSLINSFYVVEYMKLDENIFIGSGIASIQYVNVNQTRYFYFKNTKLKESINFIANFFSLNCILDIKRVFGQTKMNVDGNGYYHQDTITPNSKGYDSVYYSYEITTNATETLEPKEDDVCIFYASGLEMDNDLNKKDYTDKEILIPENVQMNNVLSTDVRSVKYLFPFVSKSGDVILDFNLEDEAPLEIRISFENSQVMHKELVGRSRSIIIKEALFRKNETENGIIPCPDDKEVCNIIIEVFARDNEYLKNKVSFELSVKTNDTIPVYVRKNLLREDLVTGGQVQYYFTDIKQNEEGEIVVNFNRGSGKMFAKMFEKTELSSTEKNAWMGKYKLPTENDTDLLKFNEFTKTAYYKKKDTKDCVNGCYLVIGVKSYLRELFVQDINFFIYDLNIYIREIIGNNQFYVNVPADEYIIGNIPRDNRMSVRLFNFYVPANSEKLLIEFQSEVCDIYLTTRGKPSPLYYEKKFSSNGKPQVFEVLAKDFGETTLKNKLFNIAIGTLSFDSIDTAVFTMKLRTPKMGYNEYIQVNSDQYTLCKTTNENNNTCYFLIDVRNEVTVQNIYMHAWGKTGTKIKYMTAKVINGSEFDFWNKNKMKEYTPIPGETGGDNIFNSETYEPDHLLIPILKYKIGDYIIIAVQTDQPTTLFYLSSFYTYVKKIVPNSATYTLFHIYSNEKTNNFLSFNFPNDNNYLIHFVSVDNDGLIDINQNTYFNLRGNHDQIAIAMKSKEDLFVNVTTKNKKGLGFYVYYEMRPEDNFDVVEFGKSTQYFYQFYENVNFPLMYYAEIPEDIDGDLDLMISFKNLTYNELQKDIFDTDDFNIKGVITDQETVFEKKKNKKINPLGKNIIYGKYDAGVRLGKIHYTKKDLEKVEKSKGRYAFVVLEKPWTNLNKYAGAQTEITIVASNSDLSAIQTNQYIVGNLNNGFKGYVKYLLKKDEIEDKFIHIQFATNGNIDWTINAKSDSVDFYRNGTKFVEKKYEGGRSLVKINCEKDSAFYLSVFYKNGNHEVKNEKLANFIFKYFSSVNNKRAEYSPKSNKIDYSFNDGTLKLKFDPLYKDNNFISTTYWVKVMTYDEKEKLNENLETISLTESNPYTITRDIIKEKKQLKDGKVEISFNNFKDNEPYDLVVFAMTNDNYREYYSYKTLVNPLNVKYSNKTSHKGVGLIVLLIFVIVGLIGFLVYIYIKMKNQNDELKKKVESISFVDNATEDLLMERKNDEHNSLNE